MNFPLVKDELGTLVLEVLSLTSVTGCFSGLSSLDMSSSIINLQSLTERPSVLHSWISSVELQQSEEDDAD